MSIYHFKADRAGKVKPGGIQSIRVEVMNQGEKSFELLLEGFIYGKKVTQVLWRIPAGFPTSSIRLKEMPTRGRPFRLQITTNRTTGDQLRIFVYAKRRGRIINSYTNQHFVMEPEAREYL